MRRLLPFAFMATLAVAAVLGHSRLEFTPGPTPATQPANAIALAIPGNPNASLPVPAPVASGVTETPSTQPSPAASASLPPGHSEVIVSPGDTMAGIFQRQGLSPASLHAISRLNEDTAALAKLAVGQRLEFRVEQGQLRELTVDLDLRNALVIRATENGYEASKLVRKIETRIASAQGRISNSLFEAAQQSGLSDLMSIRLAEIFGYDIDFVLDIRSGDQFTVIYEEHSRPGRPIESGEILAAEFVNDGQTYRAVRYVQDDGTADYYSTEGNSLKKSFLRTPVNFTRISSHFNLNRRHPVLNSIRAHKGVDYAAPIGTPVRATGDGKVAFVGTKGGYGKAIVLQHGDRYSTVYAHLSRFARAVAAGQKVRQGQTIGYVGKTGLATGPHLHYEFQVDGKHRNPLTVNLPRGEPIPDRLLADFRQQTGVWLTHLENTKRAAGFSARAATEPKVLADLPGHHH